MVFFGHGKGRKLDEADIGMIRGLMATHPGWNRTRLSREYPLVPTDQHLVIFVHTLALSMSHNPARVEARLGAAA